MLRLPYTTTRSTRICRPSNGSFGRHLLGIALLLALAAPAYSWPGVYPGGTTLYKPDKAYNGYMLYCPITANNKSNRIYLINMSGTVVHHWDTPFSALLAKLSPDGNLLVMGNNPREAPGRPGGKKYPIGGAAGWLVEYDWNGNEVFRHEDLNMHHDVVKLPNGNYVYLAWEPVPKNRIKTVRGGLKDSEFEGGVMFNDYLVEVTPQGKKIWTWHANDHLDPDIDIIGPLYKRREWLHGNALALLANGNLLITSRSTDAILVVDRKTGKITFRWGNSSVLNKKTGQVEFLGGSEHLGGPHDAREIPAGMPGAGRITCYNNRMNTGDFLFSQVIELDPATRRVVWKTPINLIGRKQFSDFLGSAQRLPNGNMLICTGADGQFMQMTPEMEYVWEYVNPYVPSPHFQGAVLKVECYPPDYCPQFKGLPPAQGPAIDPASQATLRVANQSDPVKEHPDLIPLPIALGVIGLLATLFIWNRSKRKT